MQPPASSTPTAPITTVVGAVTEHDRLTHGFDGGEHWISEFAAPGRDWTLYDAHCRNCHLTSDEREFHRAALRAQLAADGYSIVSQISRAIAGGFGECA